MNCVLTIATERASGIGPAVVLAIIILPVTETRVNVNVIALDQKMILAAPRSIHKCPYGGQGYGGAGAVRYVTFIAKVLK